MPLKTTYEIPNRENVDALIEYFNKIGGKQLSITCIRNTIFKTEWEEKQTNLKDRCEVQAASLFLQDMLNKEFSGNPHGTIKTVVADVTPIVKRLDPEGDNNFMHFSTNTLPSTLHYNFSENLFYSNKLPENRNDRYQLDLLVVYSLRLALEKRILGFLGIDFIEQNGKPPIGFSKLYPIIKTIENIEFGKNISWEEIKMVNEWLNHFIHRHLRPYPWTIHQAFEVLNTIFDSGDIVEDGRTYSSYYASTIVRDERKLHEEIEQKIKASLTDVTIYWAHQREILKTKPL